MTRYDSYKDSGVEWIGEIPSHWGFEKTKTLCERKKKTVSVEEFKSQNVLHYSIPNVQAFGTGVKELGEDIDSSKLLLLGGEVLVSKLNPRKGCVTRVRFRNDIMIIGSGEFIPLVPGRNLSATLFHYFIQSPRYSEFLDSNVESVTRSHQRVSPDVIYDVRVPLPQPSEQEQIVEYLDRKTTAIDSLIEKTVRKIELLKEKRTSLINEVVTKGLNSNVEMKDSGVEWIGEIPSHWTTKQLRYVIKNLNSGTSVNSEDISVEGANEIGILKTSCVFGDVFRPEENKRVVPHEFNRVKCPVLGNSIIFSRMNTPELVGSNGFVQEDYNYLFLPDRLWITQFYESFSLCIKWLSYVTVSAGFRNELSSRSTGTSPSMKNISKDDLLTMSVAFPDYREQEQIVEYLDQQTSIIDSTITTEENRITLLKEYRQSLISEVVTGKIKVTFNN